MDNKGAFKIIIRQQNETQQAEEILPYINPGLPILLQKYDGWNSQQPTTITIPETPSTTPLQTITLSEPLPSTSAFQPVATNENVDISYSVDCNTEFLWNSFEVPWENLTTTQVDELRRGVKNRNTITSLIHVVVNQMRGIKCIIPSKAFKIVAKKIIDKYPEVFRDIDEDGIVLGDGTHSLVCKLQDRNNYLNRPYKRKHGHSGRSLGTSNKRYVNARAGCVNWAPDVDNGGEGSTPLDIKNIRDTDDNFFEILETTYSEQRQFINKISKITEVKDQWPILFSTKAIYWHFNKLTNSNIHLLTVCNKAEKLNKFIMDKVKESVIENIKPLNLKTIIQNITLYFKEDFTSIYACYKSEDLIVVDTLPTTPFIAEVEPEEGEPMFLIFIEREKINPEGYEEFQDAMKVCFALYFIFNIQYPKNLCATMELIQRMILKIHPDAGSKSKIVHSVKRKVFNFMNKFKDYNN